MKPKFDHKVIRPGGKVYDITARTDLAKTFDRIRREQQANARERERKVAPLTRKKA